MNAPLEPARTNGEDGARTTTLSDYVYHQLFSRISSGEYQQHFKLPGEHDLARQFEVHAEASSPVPSTGCGGTG